MHHTLRHRSEMTTMQKTKKTRETKQRTRERNTQRQQGRNTKTTMERNKYTGEEKQRQRGRTTKNPRENATNIRKNAINTRETKATKERPNTARKKPKEHKKENKEHKGEKKRTQGRTATWRRTPRQSRFQAQIQQGDLPACAHPIRSGRTDAAIGRCRNAAHLHQHRQHGDRTMVCAQFIKPSTASLWRRTKKSMFVTQLAASGRRRSGHVRDDKDRNDAHYNQTYAIKFER